MDNGRENCLRMLKTPENWMFLDRLVFSALFRASTFKAFGFRKPRAFTESAMSGVKLRNYHRLWHVFFSHAWLQALLNDFAVQRHGESLLFGASARRPANVPADP